MSQHKENIEHQENIPSLENIEKKVGNTLKQSSELIQEGIPQIESCVERNNEAMKAFCTHPDVGLFSFESTKHLLQKI